MPSAPGFSPWAPAGRSTISAPSATWSHGETRAGADEPARYRGAVADLTPASTKTLLVTVSGEDRPGVTSALFDAIADVGAEVLDLEQVVVRGHLTLAVLLAGGTDDDRLRDVVSAVGRGLDLKVKVKAGTGDNRPRRRGRAVVVVLGSPLRASAVAAVTARIAAHGANIDRIRRLSRYPITTVEFDVSGADVDALRRELALESHIHAVD